MKKELDLCMYLLFMVLNYNASNVVSKPWCAVHNPCVLMHLIGASISWDLSHPLTLDLTPLLASGQGNLGLASSFGYRKPLSNH